MLKSDFRRHAASDNAPPRDAGAGSAGGLLDFHAFQLTIRRRAHLIGALVVVALLATLAALAIVPPRYAATAVILVDPRQPRVTYSETVLAGIGTDAAAVESQVELITSSSLVSRVIGRLGLADDPEFTEGSLLQRLSGDILATIGVGARPDAQTTFNRLVRRVQDSLDVRRRGLTYILEVTFTSREPTKAAKIANALAEAYLEDQRSGKLEATMKASGWLRDRIEEMRARVSDSERAVAAYKAANNIVDVGEGGKLNERQIEALNQQLILARSMAAEARARLEQTQHLSTTSGNPAALSESLQSPVIANLRAQYAEVGRRAAELSADYGDRHPTLLRMRAQLADLRREIDAEIGRILAGVRNDFEVAISREAALERDLGKLKDQAGKFDQADVRLRELQREAQANRALFEQFLARSKETSEQQSLQIADARIVSPALAPVRPARPAAALLLLVAFLGSGAVGVGLSVLVEHLDRSYRTVTQIEQDLSLPCLGIVPLAEKARTGPIPAGAGLLARLVGGRTGSSARARNLMRQVVERASSPLAISLYSIRARLRAASRGKSREVLIVVSAMPDEGKSVIASNLAHASAKAGVRTLLVDGDFRKASLTAAYGPSVSGLADVLRGELAIEDAIITDGSSGLHILTAGKHRDIADVLAQLGEERFIAVLHQLRQTYDLIVIDSPAIMLAAESRDLLEFADRAILVVEWQQTDRETVAAALSGLGAGLGKFVGFVLNKVDMAQYRLYDYGRSIMYVGPLARPANEKAVAAAAFVRCPQAPRAVS